MSRKYSEYPSLLSAAVEIACEVIEQKSSSHWSGSLEDLDELKTILSPFNIVYVDDFFGEWKQRCLTGNHK